MFEAFYLAQLIFYWRSSWSTLAELSWAKTVWEEELLLIAAKTTLLFWHTLRKLVQPLLSVISKAVIRQQEKVNNFLSKTGN